MRQYGRQTRLISFQLRYMSSLVLEELQISALSDSGRGHVLKHVSCGRFRWLAGPPRVAPSADITRKTEDGRGVGGHMLLT